VVVVVVPADPLVGPRQRRVVDEGGATGALLTRSSSAVAPGEPLEPVPRGTAGDRRDDLLALADHDRVHAELAQGRARRGRAVRPDGELDAADPVERVEQLARHPQLGRGAAPEQVRRRRRDHGEVGRNAATSARTSARDRPKRWASRRSTSCPVALQAGAGTSPSSSGRCGSRQPK
jgi:hypothetical protein